MLLRPAPLVLRLTALLLFALPAAAGVPSFDGVGDLAGGLVGSAALDVSADGTVVVGESEGADGSEAFRWTIGGGITGLGFLSMVDPYSTARGISEDGSVIVGSSHDSGGGMRAYRWSASTMTALDTQGCTDCDPATEGFGVSGDGLVVVGSSLARSGSTGTPHLDPVRWPGGGTAISNLGNLPGPTEAGEAMGASPNGSIIVGSHFSNDGKDAWYWTGSGLNALPTITGGSIIAATAFAVSDDGSTIVGYSNADTVMLPGGTTVATDLQAVRWTGASYGTLQQLGNLPGSPSINSRALAVSSDGSIIVGRAVDADVSDRAFIWDATNGMRNLKTVLTDEYGLDLSGWVLSEATGISDVVGGAFTVVGRGINPSGDPEGWVAFLTTPECNDTLDNDVDTFTDYPADLECLSPTDWSEEHDCSDGIDNDGDGDVDHPADADCLSASDPTERPDCSDGIDNDGDTLIDHPADPGCASPLGQVEDPACSDTVDNDLDLDTDYPADGECLAAWDMSETEDCSDGLDNDGDTLIDHPADPECESALDLSESPQCSDGLDNDGDTVIDYPDEYPGCVSAVDPVEAPQCSDGVDNDLDLDTDYPDDTSCTSAAGESENFLVAGAEGLWVVDRKTRAVFRVDKGTGVQTLLSQGALMTAPQGLARRGHLILVADPAGLVAVQGSGAQHLASVPLDDHESLQVVIDGPGDPYILEETEISKVAWALWGMGPKSTWLAIPTPGPFPVLAGWYGDSLAVESSGDFVTTGLSLFGDGVYRIDAGTQTASILKPGFADVRWLDLAVEDDDTILAVGYKYDEGTGVYRIDPMTGLSTALNITYGWQMPTGVTVDQDGDIYVADSGTCADGTCSGGEIVHVDPISGTATPLSSGGFIGGELDVISVPEPAEILLLLSGIAGLAALQRLRSSRRS